MAWGDGLSVENDRAFDCPVDEECLDSSGPVAGTCFLNSHS